MDDLASSTTQPFEVLWLNINGINSNHSDCNVSLLIRSFLRSNYSILFLQEPRLKEVKAKDVEKAFNWPNSKVQGFFTSNEAGNGGVATVVKKAFLQTVANFLVVELAKDECQHVTFSVGHTQFSFANLHLNSRSGSKRGQVCTTLKDTLPHGTIIGGDFNMVQDLTLDLQRPHSTTPYDNGGWQEMVDMQTHLGLTDIWRENNGDSFFFTHQSAVPGGHTRTRIDYILCPTHHTVGPHGITTSHDHVFWQGNERADHVGVSLKMTPIDIAQAGPKREAAPPHVFETQQWHELHEQHWESHMLRLEAHPTI